eukprot:GFUD01067153.1.p1 GENE.GFUD01067153.1~~GFUD01067153.1.p1  ORF type:complete len:207 (+),score=37.97 GFUD01067153.1:77-697(+)
MMYKQAMQVPVLLMIVGVIGMLCGQVSTSCSCSGYVTSKGRGECNTSYRGKKYCYVNPGQCSDQINLKVGASLAPTDRFLSYQACEKSSSPLPQVHKTQLLRALAEPVAQRTTPVGRVRVTVTQTTRTPVSQVSGAETQTVETSTLPTMPQQIAAISRWSKGSITMSMKMASSAVRPGQTVHQILRHQTWTGFPTHVGEMSTFAVR